MELLAVARGIIAGCMVIAIEGLVFILALIVWEKLRW